MKCPDLQILSRYQDGGLDEENSRLVQEHLESCPSCNERFKQLGKMGLFLRIGLGRPRKTPCLSAEELGTYLAGGVSPDHRERLEAHLAGCERCLHEVALFSDGAFEPPGEFSPVPTRRALADFALLNRKACTRRDRVRRVLVHVARTAVAAAATVLVITLTFYAGTGTPSSSEPANVTVTTEGMEPDVGVNVLGDAYTTLASLDQETEMLVADHSSLARFARQMRLILHQTMEATSSPTDERVAMLKEDVLSSGLVNSVEELSSEVKDPRIQAFLVQCKCVLLRVAKIDRNNASNDLIALVNEIQHMNLSEQARLMELEGGGSLWLTASL